MTRLSLTTALGGALAALPVLAAASLGSNPYDPPRLELDFGLEDSNDSFGGTSTLYFDSTVIYTLRHGLDLQFGLGHVASSYDYGFDIEDDKDTTGRLGLRWHVGEGHGLSVTYGRIWYSDDIWEDESSYALRYDFRGPALTLDAVYLSDVSYLDAHVFRGEVGYEVVPQLTLAAGAAVTEFDGDDRVTEFAAVARYTAGDFALWGGGGIIGQGDDLFDDGSYYEVGAAFGVVGGSEVWAAYRRSELDIFESDSVGFGVTTRFGRGLGERAFRPNEALLGTIFRIRGE